MTTTFSAEQRAISLDRLKRARAVRRVMVTVLVVFIAVSLTGYLGSKTGTATATRDGFTLTVTYPEVTRPGLPIRWEFAVSSENGFDEPIRLATTFDYIHLFDISNSEPEASSSTASARRMVYSYDPPPGKTFRVTMDGNAEPGPHETGNVSTSLLVGGKTAVTVNYQTRVVP